MSTRFVTEEESQHHRRQFKHRELTVVSSLIIQLSSNNAVQEHVLGLVDHRQQALDMSRVRSSTVHLELLSDLDPRLSHGPVVALEEDLPCPEQASIP